MSIHEIALVEPRSAEQIARHRVAMTVYDLQKAVADLTAMRHENATADFMLREEAALFIEMGKLNALVADIMTANDNAGPRKILKAAQ